MAKGTVTHLFCGGKVILILRNNWDGNVVDAWHWDSATETAEPEDGDDLEVTMRRGLEEEIGFVPKSLHFLGLTRQKGNGFFCAFLSEEEVAKIVINPHEGEKFALYTLEDTFKLQLGGSFRNHAEAYPEAFAKMAKGELPDPTELRLRPVVVTTR